MAIARTVIAGSPYIGIHLRVSDRGAVVPPSMPRTLASEVQRIFEVPTVRTTVAESEIVGALLAWNSHGGVVGDEIDDLERAALEHIVPITSLRTRYNALGNNILVNDRGAVVHPEFSDEAVRRVEKALQVPTTRGTIAGLGTVGMAGAATNRGVVVHPKATEKEAEVISEALGVPLHRSTGNFGVPIVGACLVANSHAMLVGRPTTPVEIVHLQEGFQLFDRDESKLGSSFPEPRRKRA
ncbi:MAG TPA: translation initiation factor IF-6 [Thermoplasmata archaeon]|nr:translation initiation factor IF-6 [Thermoplasmata archaeon]